MNRSELYSLMHFDKHIHLCTPTPPSGCRRFYPGRVAQLLRASSCYTEAVGLISGQGTYQKQLMNVHLSGATNRCFSLSPPPEMFFLF